MTYFPDLSRYVYRPFLSQSNPKVLNVGWLDSSAPYCTGTGPRLAGSSIALRMSTFVRSLGAKVGTRR
jgi:hypothetical protein